MVVQLGHLPLLLLLLSLEVETVVKGLFVDTFILNATVFTDRSVVFSHDSFVKVVLDRLRVLGDSISLELGV